MAEANGGNGGRRGINWSAALLAPQFLFGIGSAFCAYLWFDSGQSSQVKANTADITHKEEEIQALDKRIEQYRENQDRTNREDQQQYQTLDGHYQHLSGQLGYLIKTGPGE